MSVQTRNTTAGTLVILATAAAVTVAMLFGGGIYLWQHARTTELQRQLATAQAEIATLERRVATYRATETSDTTATTRQFAFIRSLERSGTKIVTTVDYAQMLSGDDAATAATAHGDESPPPNDYYIVNDNPKLRDFTVSKTAKVVFWTWPGRVAEATPKSVSTLLDVFSGSDPDLRGVRGAPYWLTVSGSTITKIEEQYLP